MCSQTKNELSEYGQFLNGYSVAAEMHHDIPSLTLPVMYGELCKQLQVQGEPVPSADEVRGMVRYFQDFNTEEEPQMTETTSTTPENDKFEEFMVANPDSNATTHPEGQVLMGRAAAEFGYSLGDRSVNDVTFQLAAGFAGLTYEEIAAADAYFKERRAAERAADDNQKVSA